MNIDTGKFFSVREPNAYLVQVEGNQMIRTQPGLRALDGDFNELPEWKAIKSRRSGTPVLSEGLLYLDVRRLSLIHILNFSGCVGLKRRMHSPFTHPFAMRMQQDVQIYIEVQMT